MIERARLTAELRKQVDALVEDLRQRAATVPEVGEAVAAEWRAAHDAGRTAQTEKVWRDGLLAQVAAAWVLGGVFVRFSEDNGLIPQPLIAGAGDQRRWVTEAQVLWFREHRAAGERDYLRHVFTQAARHPGLDQVLGRHNPLWLFGPSDDAARALLELWRQTDPQTGALQRDFTDPTNDTRFLGDLYQDLSEHAKKTYALLQTPDFVERFILDRTLEPAVDEFGLDGFRMIDPACGSGHFLLGSFQRLFERWTAKDPAAGNRWNAARALEAVHGVDVNPFAVAIARFRLLVAALRAAGVAPLADAPHFALNVATGDSLYHYPPHGRLPGVLEADELFRDKGEHRYATEDRRELRLYLEAKYHAVVANPPYITPKDPALNQAYRDRYATCSGKYALTVPFMERLFDLAVRGSNGQPAGFVGQITSNSFMKREFGKKLVEEFLATEVDLTHVIDLGSLRLDGHTTPTVILFGRNRAPLRDRVRAVLGIRGENPQPADLGKGLVWTSITALVDEPGRENEYVTSADIDRLLLAKHPWSLQGGAAGPLKERIEAGTTPMISVVDSIGITCFTLEDEFYIRTPASLRTRQIPPESTRPMVEGDRLRDWMEDQFNTALFPYHPDTLKVIEALDPRMEQLLWVGRTCLSNNLMFGGKTKTQAGLRWYEFGRFTASKLRTPLSIAFAFVATHNHFVLDRGGKVFNRSAPVIKLAPGASEAAHLELLGPLNSAVGCFWMKQIGQPKPNPGDSLAELRFEFDGTKLKQFPLPAGSALAWAARLDALAQELSAWLPASLFAEQTPTAARLAQSQERVAALRARLVGLQEELDWRCAFLYGVTPEDLALPPDAAPALERGERAFEIHLARQMAAGEVETTWFARHRSTPRTEPPAHWSQEYKEVVERRLALIGADRFVGLVERPEYKRRWNWEPWEDLAAQALRSWLLDRLEDPRFWPALEARSVNQLADAVRADPDFVAVAGLYRGGVAELDLVGLVALVGELTADQAVPYLAAWRYTDSGLRARAQWEATWDLQRREDAGEAVGPIAVPPRYGSADFATKAGWALRGKLDVPKERFVSYPGAERDIDPSPVLGWAGWDHLQQAKALAALYQHRAQQDGWPTGRLVPLLAGLAELVPWLRQWHNERDPNLGEGLGDYFAGFVSGELHRLGLSPDDLAAWRPAARGRGRGRPRRAAAEDDENEEAGEW